jgi:hypothetical protein
MKHLAVRILTRKYRIRQQHTGTQKCLPVTCAHPATKPLKLRPYRFQPLHQLQERDTAAGIQYCHWCRRFVPEGAQGCVLNGTHRTLE